MIVTEGNTFMGKSRNHRRKLVYFVCKADERVFNLVEILKTAAYEVHIFDNHTAALDCCSECDVPDIVVTTPFVSSIDTWEFVFLVRDLSHKLKLPIPFLVLLKYPINLDIAANSTGLKKENFLSYPFDKNEFLQKVAGIIGHGYSQEKKIVAICADETDFPDSYRCILMETGYHLVRIGNVKALARGPSDVYTFILIGLQDAGASLKKTIGCLVQEFPDVPILGLTGKVSFKQKCELIRLGLSSVIPRSCAPGEFLHRCHEAVSHHNFRRWISRISLMEKEFNDKAGLYQRVVESQNDLLCKWLPDTTLTYVNNAVCELLKSTSRKLIGKPFSDIVIPDGNVSIEAITTDILESGQIISFEHGYIDAGRAVRWHHWTCSPVYSEDGLPIEVLAVGRDISALKKLEIAQEDSYAELQSLFEGTPNQLWYLSDPKTYRAANSKHAEFFGKSVHELENCPIDKVYSSEDVETFLQLNTQVVTTGDTINAERTVTNGSGERCVLQITEKPCLDDRGRLRFIVCSAIDVTAERMRELNLAFRAELEHLISEISSGFMHQDVPQIDNDIRTSLEKIGEFIGSDRVYICFINDSGDTLHPAYSWTARSAKINTKFIEKNHTFFMGMLNNLDTVYISNPADLPDTAGKETQYFKKHRIQSMLIIPIESNRSLAGYIAFEAIQAGRAWESDIQRLIKFYSELLFNTIQKTKAWEFIRSERDFGLVLNYANSLDESLSICLDYILEISGMNAGGIYLVDPVDQALKLAKYRNMAKKFVDKVEYLPPETRQHQLVFQGKPIYVSWEQIQKPELQYVIDEGIKALCSLPVVFRNEVIGCVNIASRDRYGFTEFVRSTLEVSVPRLGPLIAKARVDEEIRRNWSNLNMLFNSIKDYLIITDARGLVVHINETCRTTLGFPIDALRDKHIADFYSPDCRETFLSLLSEDLHEVKSEINASLLTAGGAKIPVAARCIRGEWQDRPAWFVFNHDLTRQKEEEDHRLGLEMQVQQAQKIESLSRMAGAIAHRFNNLLMGIIGNLELAKMLIDQDSRAVEKLKQAESAAQRATDLGKLMLMYVGQIGTTRALCCVSEIVENLMPLLRASAPSDVRFETDFESDLPLVSANISSLHQVVMNLVSNAWESFDEEAGIIHLETMAVRIPETFNEKLVENEILPPGDYICLSVTDNGSGMDGGTIDRMFDPFFTTKFTGRGLGLSSVLGIVRAHGGGISVMSEQGVSTRITVLFPVVESSRVLNHKVDNTQPELNRKLVLLVDDDGDIREVARQMLENLGCLVIEAGDGIQAIELFEKNKTAVSCVICDIKMPDLDGWQTMEAIRKIRPDIPVVLVTGYGLTSAEMENRPEPYALIQKPYRLQNLLNILKQV
jgi:PAS domain S-box-containing protein